MRHESESISARASKRAAVKSGSIFAAGWQGIVVPDAKSARASKRHADKSVSLFARPWQRILAEAKLYWPRNTAKRLAKLTGKSQRTCYRWFAPRNGGTPDADDLLAIIAAMRVDWLARGKIFEQFEFDLH